MEITEVRVKLMEESSERLQAFCSITFDHCFVVRDLKIIDGTNGPFVAMPSRKLTAHCPKCRSKNHLRAAHCNQCGARLNADQAIRDEDGRAKLYADIAHPINSACREMIQERVIQEFRKEQALAAEPGYRSRYDEFDTDIDYDEIREPVERSVQRMPFTAEPAETRDKSFEQTRVQPAESSQPRPPHSTPSQAPATKHAPAPSEQRHLETEGGFGAGIF